MYIFFLLCSNRCLYYTQERKKENARREKKGYKSLNLWKSDKEKKIKSKHWWYIWGKREKEHPLHTHTYIYIYPYATRISIYTHIAVFACTFLYTFCDWHKMYIYALVRKRKRERERAKEKEIVAQQLLTAKKRLFLAFCVSLHTIHINTSINAYHTTQYTWINYWCVKQIHRWIHYSLLFLGVLNGDIFERKNCRK